jgi:hydrogenase maturation protein HypF
MAENRHSDAVLGISFDGTGYGTDGAIWGGEILKANLSAFERLAHLKYVPLAGGDLSIRKPYRMALAHLWAAGIAWDEDLPPVQACSATEREILSRQLERSINTVPTSSIGRLFDAVASLIGIRQIVSYEAQAAIEMEALLVPSEATYCFCYEHGVIDPSPILKAIIDDMRVGISQAVIAGRFHQAIVGLILEMAKRYSLPTVALSGGVFQNIYLRCHVKQSLEANGYHVLLHRQVPCTDAGLALGQAAILAHHLRKDILF